MSIERNVRRMLFDKAMLLTKDSNLPEVDLMFDRHKELFGTEQIYLGDYVYYMAGRYKVYYHFRKRYKCRLNFSEFSHSCCFDCKHYDECKFKKNHPRG